MRSFSMNQREAGFDALDIRTVGGLGGIVAVLLLLFAASSASGSDNRPHATAMLAQTSDAG